MSEFEEYVKRYAECRGISVEEAKRHKIVAIYREYLEDRDK